MESLGKWFRGLRLRLVIVGFVPVAALAVVAFFGIKTSLHLSDELYKAYEVRAKLIEQSGDMEANAHATVRMVWTVIQEHNPDEQARIITRAREHMARFDEAMKAYLDMPRSSDMVKLFKNVEEHWPEAKKDIDNIFKAATNGEENAREAAIHLVTSNLRLHVNQINNTINEMQTIRRDMMDREVNQMVDETKASVAFLISLSVIAGVVSVILGLFIASRVATSILNVTNVLNSSSEQVSSAAAQIASASQELSSATSEQAASLEQTAASLEEMSSMVAKNTENSKNAASTSSQSQDKANEGRDAVTRMLSSMKEIDRSNDAIVTQVNHSNEQMTEIVKVIQEIGNKTKVINDIVFQTKLLSFNASVEAARAGEHGKGFAVVAEEVGNLAQMSGNAAKEISDMLEGSIAKVDSIVNETKVKVEALIAEGKSKVDFGSQVAEQCSEVLHEIVSNVDRVSSMANDISAASLEQSQGINEINKAMGQLDTVTQQNAAGSEETASAAEELSAQAETLKAAVLDLVLVVEGRSQESSPSRPVPRMNAPKSNVVKFTQNKVEKKVAAPVARPKPTADGSIPDRDHDGFTDI